MDPRDLPRSDNVTILGADAKFKGELTLEGVGRINGVFEGSIKAGETLATTGGNGKTIQCSVCHGPDYKGVGNVPPLAGRSAIYIYRQLNDIQHGTRHGNAVALMQPVVAKLSSDDMIALAAFMASRTP